MDYAIRTAPREQLVAELRQSAADRAEHGKHERANEATAAADALERGLVDCAHYERVLYEVGEEASRASVTRLTREQLVAELDEAGAGWAHQGETGLAHEAARAYWAVKDDAATSVRVGHQVYEVLEPAVQVVHP